MDRPPKIEVMYSQKKNKRLYVCNNYKFYFQVKLKFHTVPRLKHMDRPPKIEVMYSQKKNKRLYVCNNYKFYFQVKLKDGVERWSCTQRLCRAFLKISPNLEVLESLEAHNHSPIDEKRLSRERVSNTVKRKVAEDISTRPNELVQEELAGDAIPPILTVSDIHLIKRCARRERQRIKETTIWDKKTVVAGRPPSSPLPSLNSSKDSALVWEPAVKIEKVDGPGEENESADLPAEAECILGCPASPQTSQYQPFDPSSNAQKQDWQELSSSVQGLAAGLNQPELATEAAMDTDLPQDAECILGCPPPSPQSPQRDASQPQKLPQPLANPYQSLENPAHSIAKSFQPLPDPAQTIANQRSETHPNASQPLGDPSDPRRQQERRLLSEFSEALSVANGQTEIEDPPRRNPNDEADQNDKFGEYVASHLRQLPLRNALKLQAKIQCLILKERLACLHD